MATHLPTPRISREFGTWLQSAFFDSCHPDFREVEKNASQFMTREIWGVEPRETDTL